MEVGEIKRETKMEKKKKSQVWVIVKFEMRKNRKIDLVIESGKLR